MTNMVNASAGAGEMHPRKPLLCWHRRFWNGNSSFGKVLHFHRTWRRIEDQLLHGCT